MIPTADGIYDAYDRRPAAIRYGADAAGPPVRFANGRFVQLDDPRLPNAVIYGATGGVYSQYYQEPQSVTYGP